MNLHVYTMYTAKITMSRSLPIDIVWVKFEPNLTKKKEIMLRTNE